MYVYVYGYLHVYVYAVNKYTYMNMYVYIYDALEQQNKIDESVPVILKWGNIGKELFARNATVSSDFVIHPSII